MSYTHLTPNQRVELSVLLRAGQKQKDIAKMLGKDPSTISRELKRNSGAFNKTGYDARIAQNRTTARRITANQRFRKLENSAHLKNYVITRLKKCWSPEQIAGRLRRKHHHNVISHETIYKFVRKEKLEYKQYLRCRKGKYRRRYGAKKREKERPEAKKRIDTRPLIVEKRKRIGDWEGDLIFGQERKIGILVHVDRKSGYALADKLNCLLAKTVKQATINRFQKLPRSKRHTITYDNDTRFADHELTERGTKADIYFAHPYSSWERGTNENTNGLLRQFFPKKSSFAKIKQEHVEKTLTLLNNRPRKRLNYLTPDEVFKN